MVIGDGGEGVVVRGCQCGDGWPLVTVESRRGNAGGCRNSRKNAPTLGV